MVRPFQESSIHRQGARAMKTCTAIVVTALAAAVAWVPAAPAQARGADAGGIPPQLQTDAQRHAAREQQRAQESAMQQGQQGGQWEGDGQYPDAYPAQAPYAVDGRPVATGIGAAMAIDALNAASGAATNAILRSNGRPYPQLRSDKDRGDPGAGQARPAEGRP
jgi:hypothetical protein